jgi:pimeloyl-ACP methyl ester carboxylesterase
MAPYTERKNFRMKLAETKDVYIERGGVRLHALDHGGDGGPIILFLHGAVAHAHWWDTIAPGLADMGRPVAVDLRGHGESDWSDDYSYGAFAEDLGAWIDWAAAEGGGPPGLIAHSFGGGTTLKLHESSRPDLRFTILVDVPLGISERIIGPMRKLADRPSRPWSSRELFVEKFRVVPPGDNASPDLLAHIARHSVRPLDDGTWVLKADKSFHKDRPTTDLRPGWRRVSSPAMLIVGGKSDRLSGEDLEWVRTCEASVRIETVPEAYHHVLLDDPDTLVELTRDFLSSLY